MSTNIEWTDKTWNPIIGCSHVSPACDHCYAEKMANRLAFNPNTAAYYASVVNESGGWNGKTELVESALDKPLHWRKPCRVFVGSMTDMFHPSTPDSWLAAVFTIIAKTPHITYQILTKRPERMRQYMSVAGQAKPDGSGGLKMSPFHNVWLGVTVENQAMADNRIPILLDTPAAVRFVSVEPMLGPVDLESVEYQKDCFTNALWSEWDDDKLENVKPLDWVICGGETGPGAREMESAWPMDLRLQCKASGVPFFFKKWGSAWGNGTNDGHIGGKLRREFPTQNGGSGDE